MFFSKEKSILGVDIGTSYIKLAQITHTGKRKVLDTYGIVNAGGHVSLASNQSSIEDTASLLVQLMEQARVTTRRCVASLPNTAVFISVIDMPIMNEEELQQSIQFEAKKYIPLPFAEVQLTWSIITTNPETKNMKVLLIAVPKQMKETYLKVCELAGLELEVLDIEALALIRAVAPPGTLNSVIIDMGAKATGLNIIRNGVLQLSRNINIGGDVITRRLAETLKVSDNRAEQFKKDFGVSDEVAFMPESVQPVLDSIKTELRQILSIYQSQNSVLDAMYIVGGGAKLPGITKVFEEFNMPVQLGNPLQFVAYNPAGEKILQRYGLQLAVAIGLALRNES